MKSNFTNSSTNLCIGKISILLFVLMNTFTTVIAQNTTTWVGGDFPRPYDYNNASNWSNGMPEPGKDAIIPEADYYPEILDDTNGSVEVDYKITIQPDGKLKVTENSLTIKSTGEVYIEEYGEIIVDHAMNVNSGAYLLNEGSIYMNSVMNNYGSIDNIGDIWMYSPSGAVLTNKSGGYIYNIGYIEVDDSDLENNGNIDNQDGGLMNIRLGGKLKNYNNLTNSNGTVKIGGEFWNHPGSTFENHQDFEVIATGEVYIEKAEYNSEVFNYDNVKNEGKIYLQGGDFFNKDQAVFNNEPGGLLHINSVNSAFTNEEGGTFYNKNGADFIFIRLGSFNNDGILNNYDLIENRHFFFNNGTMTNFASGAIENYKNPVNPNFPTLFSTDGLFTNNGNFIAGSNTSAVTITNDSGGTFIQDTGGSMTISSLSSFENESCALFVQHSTVANNNEFINKGYIQHVSGSFTGNQPTFEEGGLQLSYAPPSGNYNGQSKLFVNGNAAGNNDGLSWNNAIPHVQAALYTAKCNMLNEIWVAAGNYYTTVSEHEQETFYIPSGVKIYGGFDGTETNVNQADPMQHTTVLDGDYTAYHVITVEETLGTTHVIGFTIARGNAYGPGLHEDHGGGVLHRSNGATSTITFKKCIFESNGADRWGGAMYCKGAGGNNTYTTTHLQNCIFKGNIAKYGGAINIDGGSGISKVIATGCNFFDNGATVAGADIRGYKGGLQATDCIFWASLGVDPITLSDPTHDDVEYCIVDGGYPTGSNIIDEDPYFVNPYSGDFHLQNNSPAIDEGDASLPNDIEGNPRPFGDGPDIGAYEFSAPLPVELTVFRAWLTAQKTVQLHWETANELDNDFFIIERSDDGIHFTPILQVNGHGTTDQVHTYTAIDEKPFPGLNYYRLQQIDFSGRNSIVEIQVVDVPDINNNATIFPNPTTDLVNINLGQTGTPVRISMYTSLGQLVKEFYFETPSDNINISLLDRQVSVDNNYYFAIKQGGETDYLQVHLMKK